MLVLIVILLMLFVVWCLLFGIRLISFVIDLYCWFGCGESEDVMIMYLYCFVVGMYWEEIGKDLDCKFEKEYDDIYEYEMMCCDYDCDGCYEYDYEYQLEYDYGDCCWLDYFSEIQIRILLN